VLGPVLVPVPVLELEAVIVAAVVAFAVVLKRLTLIEEEMDLTTHLIAMTRNQTFSSV
jgi:hypothetical protein